MRKVAGIQPRCSKSARPRSGRGRVRRAPHQIPACAGMGEGPRYSFTFRAGTGSEQMSSWFTGGAMKAAIPE